MTAGQTYIVWIVLGLVVVAVVWAYVLRKKKSNADNPSENQGLVPAAQTKQLIREETQKPLVEFSNLSALSPDEESCLIEIRDPKLLERIDQAIPGTLQAVANTGAVHAYHQAVESAGQLYQAIIPQGAKLTHSLDMDGAVRGFYHGADGIKGHANFVAVDGNPANGLATMSAVNAVMGVASMVVGQYYMTQINGKLDEINDEISRIANFQDNEFKSKVYALTAAIQKCSTFQLEIMDNDELRNRELIRLDNLEHECTELLGQANLMLNEYSQRNNLKYGDYEKSVYDANSWFQYQQILLELLGKIEDLIFTLNKGAVSKENCFSRYALYSRMSEESLDKLFDWHYDTLKRLGVDTFAFRRKRQGVNGFLMKIPAVFNDNLHYKGISERTAKMINLQICGSTEQELNARSDLFQNDVRLIAKDGSLYYLPTHQA